MICHFCAGDLDDFALPRPVQVGTFAPLRPARSGEGFLAGSGFFVAEQFCSEQFGPSNFQD